MSEYDEEEILCAITGIVPTENELDLTEDGVPEGWIKLIAERKFVNPKWEAIQMVKQGLMQQTLAAIAENDRENQLINVAIQVEAQFALLESQTDQFFTVSEEVIIAPPETNEYLQKAVAETLSMLGFVEIFNVEDEEEGAEPVISNEEKAEEKEQETEKA
jgi:hypothetical protein